MVRLSLLCFLFLAGIPTECGTGWQPACVRAQGPISGFPTPKGEVAVALSYGRETYDNYFLPDDQQEARSITTVSYSLFAEAGLTENTAVVVTLPWMRNNDGTGSLQDGSVWLKYMNLDRRRGRAANRFFTAVGLSLPVGNYETEGQEALGQRATVFQGRLTYQYQHDAGWFLSAQSGIDFQIAPEAASAWPLLLRGGYGNKFFYVEGWLEFITSLDGGTTVTGAATGTGSSWRRVGGTVFLPVTKRAGVTLAGARVLSGTFIGDSLRWSAGVVVKIGG